MSQCWNQQNFSNLEELLHPEYQDYSLPAGFPPGMEGTLKWIAATSASFEHQTVIERLVSEGPSCILRVTLYLTHTGTWRHIPATGITVQTPGYREFHFRDGKIRTHHALIDGQTIENALMQTAHGCRL